MPSPTLTPSQVALLQAMQQVLASGQYHNALQATFPTDVPPSILFFPYRQGDDLVTVSGTESDFLALVQHGEIILAHQWPRAYAGHLTRPDAPG